MTETLKTALSEVCSYLAEGEAWHRRAANQCRKNAVRGWGRWHDAEAMDDAKCRTCLEKLLEDYLHYEPDIMTDQIVRAEIYEMGSSMADFKAHHAQWLERENRLISSLNAAIYEMRATNIELYHKLFETQCEVQNEAMRVELVVARLDLAGWNGHDLGVCSMIIHKYFEHEYTGGKIDFNIG